MVVVICMVLSGVLFAWGGFSFLLARRIIMPIVITASLFLITHSLWSMTALLSYPFLSLGYGDKSWFRHCFGDGWGRGVWGLLVALSLCLGLTTQGYIHWYWAVLYCGVCFAGEDGLKRLYQLGGDFCIGILFGSVSLLASLK